MAITDVLVRQATWKKTIILLLAQFVAQGLILFWAYPMLGGQGLPLDMRPGLTFAEVQEYLASIGPEGRKIYALNEGILDVLYPLLYSFAYSFLLLRLLLPLSGATSRWNHLALLPFGIAAADLGENISILGALAAYPGPGAWPRLVVVFNGVKSSLIMLSVAILLLVIVLRLVFLLFKRRGGSPAAP